ncbi:hypothetical protein V5O48_005442, partial [Marasmius crinis-equi]
SVLQKLSNRAAFSALYDSETRGQRTGVYEGTREDFIRRLIGWIETPGGRGRVYWVRGGAGVGKSAVAQTICEKYAGSRLAATHFFSRNDNLRNSMDRFIPTIAYQLAESHGPSSQLTLRIGKLLTSNPRVMHLDWEEQFRRLICQPCAAIDEELWTNLPRLVVIDGLDECLDHDPQTKGTDQRPGSREEQRRLLSMIWNATSTHPSLPLHFLIFSRPEPAISNFFRSHTFIPALEEFDMRELRAQADADIKTYLRHEFARFPDLHPDAGLEESWPGEDAINILTFNADGHFIYVVTAVKYVAGDNSILLLPQDRLEVVLRTSQTSLYPDMSPLDQLYQHVLRPFMDLREKILLPILQLIISPHQNAIIAGIGPTFSPKNGLVCRSRHAISRLLKLDSRQVSVVLSRLHSVLHIPDDEHHQNVSVLHASFLDFLIEKRRSHQFHVEPLRDRAYFGMVSQCLLPVLNDLARRYDTGEKMRPGITSFELYSLDVWLFIGVVFDIVDSSHRGTSLEDYIPSEELLHAINEFNVYHYINMLIDWEYMSHIYMVFPRLIRERTRTQRMQSASGLLSPYTSRFCSQLGPFIDKHRSLFEDGWQIMVPRSCTAVTLSQLGLLVAAVCSPLSSPSTAYQDNYLKFLFLPNDTRNDRLRGSFRNSPQGTDLAVIPDGSDVWFISSEKGRVLVDGVRTLGNKLGSDFNKEWGRWISPFKTQPFAGLDDWNKKISDLLSLYPAVEEDTSKSDLDLTTDAGGRQGQANDDASVERSVKVVLCSEACSLHLLTMTVHCALVTVGSKAQQVRSTHFEDEDLH